MATATWIRAKVNPLRLKNLFARWSVKGGKFDSEGYLLNGPAVDVWGRNRYTKVPVNEQGVTSTTWAFMQWVLARFPDSPTRVNYGVMRNRRGTASLSDHAKGEAADIITQKWDGSLGISVYDKTKGRELFDAIVADMQAGPSGRGWNGRRWAGSCRTYYVLHLGLTCRADEGCVVRPIKAGDPHNDHLHWSGVPEMKPEAVPVVGTPPIDPPPIVKEPRRTLRYRRWAPMRGDDVKLVQRVVGTKVDGWFGPATKSAVMIWQSKNGCHVDGVVGPQTWAAIDKRLTP